MLPSCACLLAGDIEMAEPNRVQNGCYGDRIDQKPKLAEAMIDAEPPEAGRTHEHRTAAIRQYGAKEWRDPVRTLLGRPHQDVGVRQNRHRQLVGPIGPSSGRGAS